MKPFVFYKAKYVRKDTECFVVNLCTDKIEYTAFPFEFPVGMKVEDIPKEKLNEFTITKF